VIEKLVIGNVWFALVIGTIVFAAGFYLYFYAARLYHAGAKNTIVLEGSYELMPMFQDIIAGRRLVNAKLAAALLVAPIAIAIVWEVCVRQYARPDIFAFLMGGLLLIEIAVGMRHLRNIVFFRHAQRAEGFRGKIEYSRRLIATQAFVELYSFAALYVLMFLVSGSWFFLGGALTCFVAGRRYRDWTKVFT